MGQRPVILLKGQLYDRQTSKRADGQIILQSTHQKQIYKNNDAK